MNDHSPNRFPSSSLVCWNGLRVTLPPGCQAAVTAREAICIEQDFKPLFQLRWMYGKTDQPEKMLARACQLSTPLAIESLELSTNPGERRMARLCRTPDDILQGGYLELHHRTVFFQVLGKWKSQRSPSAPGYPQGLARLCETIEESAPDEPLVWEINGAAFRTPKGLYLSSYRLDPGRIYLELGGWPEKWQICLLRRGQERLNSSGLKKLFARMLGAPQETTRIRALSPLHYEYSRTPHWLTQFFRRMQKRPACQRACVWYDGQSDRITCVVRQTANHTTKELFYDTLANHDLFPKEKNTASTSSNSPHQGQGP